MSDSNSTTTELPEGVDASGSAPAEFRTGGVEPAAPTAGADSPASHRQPRPSWVKFTDEQLLDDLGPSRRQPEASVTCFREHEGVPLLDVQPSERFFREHDPE